MEHTERIALPELTAVNDHGFGALVERQARLVFRVAYAVLRQRQDAEDVVQDLFLKLHRTGAWRQAENEQAFLARSAWRLAVDRVKKRPVRMPDGLSIASHEQAVLDGDEASAVHRLIDALPEELRQPLALSALEEWNSRQIAEVMGIPEGTVRTRLMRARQMLREKLARGQR